MAGGEVAYFSGVISPCPLKSMDIRPADLLERRESHSAWIVTIRAPLLVDGT